MLNDWLIAAVEKEASDLHLVVGHPPMLRVHGKIVPLRASVLDPATAEELLRGACPPEIFEPFLIYKNADFSFTIPVVTSNSPPTPRRFRANYFFNGGAMGACFRVIPNEIPTLAWAGFPEATAEKLAHYRNGLVLFTGASGSGKTTSLAMLIESLNQEGGYRIITIEEPVEYVFPVRQQTVITQREVGVDVDSFADGLKYALRQDPDVILVGEVRDRPTAQMALSAAETGHLVFATLHTRDAKGAITRFVDLFPQTVQMEIRAQLAMSMRAAVSQHLLPSCVEGQKRELALEILYNNSPIASAIRFSKLESIDNYILTGRSEGMITLDESVKQLYLAGKITRETAVRYSNDFNAGTK